MNISEFTVNYLNDKLSTKNKTVILMDDFNIDIDILQYEKENKVSEFLDSMYSNLLMPHISTPTRISSQSQTLIDNIYCNSMENDLISGNIVTTISDHYAQFLLFKNINLAKDTVPIIYEHDFTNFDARQFETELNAIPWDDVLKININNVNDSLTSFLDTFKNLLLEHAPLKKLSKKKHKLKQKPWITKGIL